MCTVSIYVIVIHMIYVHLYLIVLLGESGNQPSPIWHGYATDIPPTASTHTVTDPRLRPSQAYQFQVSAVNAVGKGRASAPSRVIPLPEQRTYHVSVTV